MRREGDGISRYVHLGTGNYNAVTARLYTDLDLFTCDETIGQDATELFNFLTGFSRSDTASCWSAPSTCASASKPCSNARSSTSTPAAAATSSSR